MPTLVHDTNWVAAPNTSAVSAGSTLYDGWIDVAGGIWSINSSQLLGTTSDVTGYSVADSLIRPLVEALQDEQIVVDVPSISSTAFEAVILRSNSSNTYYLCEFTQTVIRFYAVVLGAPTLLSTVSWSGIYTAGHTYEILFSATGISSTTLAATITDTTSSTVVATGSTSDNTSGLQTTGRMGMLTWALSGSVSVPFTRSRTYDLSGSGPLTTGVASPGANTNTQINATCTVATGGTSPYTYQWYRSTTSGFTPGGGNILSGATSLTLADTTASTGTIYYYKLVSTDSAGTPATVTSNPIVGNLWLVPLILGFIGDSITIQDPGNGTPPTLTGAIIQKIRGQRQVTIVNQGVSGTYSTNWISGSSDLTTAKAAFLSAGVTYVLVMIGTNDGRDDVLNSATTYSTNMASMVGDLVGAGYVVVLNYSPYAIPGSLSNWSEASDVLIQSYQAKLNALVNGTTVLQGDTTYYQYSAEHPTETNDGIHPNTLGATSLSNLWATAFDRATNPAAQPTSF